MKLNKLSMNTDCTNQCDELTLNEFLKRHSNIIVDPGINWCGLQQVTEEQLAQLKEIFKREKIYQYDVYEKSFGLVGHMSHVIQARKWFNDPKCLPGKQEKSRLITQLQEAKRSGKHTGIHPRVYDELLEKLYAIPDTEDIEGYSLRYHY